jgi:threonine/homoserine/homoserine lactone efflux protein
LFALLLQTVLISLSGVMSPGPITAVAIGKGGESPYAGVYIALGHATVELPLMLLIYFGVGSVLGVASVKTAIFILGGLFLIFMGGSMLRNAGTLHAESAGAATTPFIAGMLLSIWNPYFLVWWATVGAALIVKAFGLGVLGFLLFALLHWLCDGVWLLFLSAASFRGGKVFGSVFRKTVFVVCGLFLLVFGGKFLLDAFRMIAG